MPDRPEAAGQILYLGGGVRGLHCLEALLRAGEPVVGVVGHAATEQSESAALANGAGIPFRAPTDPNAPEMLDWAGKLGGSLAVMSGYNRILRSRFLVDALTPIDDFNAQFDADFPDDEYDTIGGLVISAIGHLPEVGEELDLGRFHFRVARADQRRVHSFLVGVHAAT